MNEGARPPAKREGLLQDKLGSIVTELLAATMASRTTIRLDDRDLGFHINDVAAEALATGEPSLRGKTSIDQRAAATAQWIDRHRRLLVQGDLAADEPRAPEALIRAYGVKAQMLAPIVRDGRLDGWVSVHESRATRIWTECDQAAAMRAVDQVLKVLSGIDRGRVGKVEKCD